MSPSPYSEDSLVQQTTADYLEQWLGWRSVLAWNQEDFGPNSLLGRGSEREVVLTRTLRERLVALTPGLPTEAYDDAMRQVVASPVAQSLAATNRDEYAQLRDGVWVTFRDAKGERCRERLQLIDFDDHLRNREQADILHVIRDLHRIAGEAIEVSWPADRTRETGRHVMRAYPRVLSPVYALQGQRPTAH